MTFIRAYLRASTTEQDATRAKDSLIDFATSHNQKIASFYTENESGRKLERPVLMQLISEATKGDIILIEAIDRLTRLTMSDWEALKLMIQQKGLQIVALDAPTGHMAMTANHTDELTHSILKAVNSMLMDMLAAMASKDYEQRRLRSAQGIAKAKELGKYKGRPENTELHNKIIKLLGAGMTYSEIRDTTGASRTTISKVKKSLEFVS